MHLNNLKPAEGSKQSKKRLGRGIGSGLGKTCGKGHKGQHARSGGYHKVGFQGGQMPIQRQLPKFGFNSRMANYKASVRLTSLVRMTDDVIDLDALKKGGIVKAHIREVKIYKDNEIDKAINLSGIKVTKGAKEAIEKLGGKVE